jgi:hypothetical protein
MVKLILRMILLVALLAVMLYSSAALYANAVCICITSGGDKNGQTHGGCTFDKKTAQCVDTGCPGTCLYVGP